MIRGEVSESNILKCTLDENHEYCRPKREIFTMAQMKQWETSETYNDYFGFIKAINVAVRGKGPNYECHTSEVTQGLLKLISTLDEFITNTPPINQPQRFGNQAFKAWYEKVKQNSQHLLEDALPSQFHKAIIEIQDYLIESFGNSTRIDYGTGHEMSFCMFLLCLFKIGAFTEEDAAAVVLKIFSNYLTLIRRLQTTYRMEPAGTHGVWSLDDYQFIPFVWGSSQFVGKPVIDPHMFVKEDVIKKYEDYLFIGCIKYISTVKTSGHFSEHSNQLWNISGVSSWAKINEGLIKMYRGEVLAKFPVVQHIVFGSLLRFPKTVMNDAEKKEQISASKGVL